MRNINHLLCESKTGKSAVLKIEIDDSSVRKQLTLLLLKDGERI